MDGLLATYVVTSHTKIARSQNIKAFKCHDYSRWHSLVTADRKV